MEGVRSQMQALVEQGFKSLVGSVWSQVQEAQHRGEHVTLERLVMMIWPERAENAEEIAYEIAGERLQLSQRQVRRHIADLEQAGFLKRVERRGGHRGKLTNEYDLSGLVEKGKKLEPDFRDAQEARRRVSRRGGFATRGSRPTGTR